MMRPTQQVITTSGRGTPVPLDRYVNGYAIAVTMKTAGANYTVKQCFDDPCLDPNGNPYTTSYNVSGAWLDSDDPIMVKASTNRTSNFSYPPRAVRVSAISKVSAGNPLVFTIVPMGMDGC